MLLKLTLTTKLIVFISITVLASQTVTSSSVKGGSTSSTSSVTSKTSSSSSTATTGKQFQVTTANLAVTSEPSVSSSKNFRDSLRTKSKLVSGGSVPVYSGTIYKQTRPVPDDEALPEVNLDSSAERTDKSLSSGEEFQRILGAETTSVQPIFEDDVTTSTPLVLISKQKSLQQEPVQEVEDAELITANRVSHKHHAGQRIQAAVKTKHTFEFRPVMLDHLQEEIQPKIIEVAAKSVPLEIHFKSASSRIKLVQSHKSGELQQIERTSSNEEPQRLIHISHKPIIQEVREVITPYRRIVQEIQPVMEEIHTIVSHEKEGRTSGKLTHSKTSSTTSSSSVTSKQQHTAQTTQTQKTQQQKIEQQKIPTSWLRPVSNQIQSQSTSTSSNSQQQQGKIEQQKINYSPVFNTYPLEVTSARPLLVNEEADQSEHGSNSEVEDLSDTSIEVVSGNDLNNIIPARVMQEIMHEYQVRVQAKEKAQQQQQQIQHHHHQQQQQVSRPSAPRPSAQQNTKGGQTGFNVQQPQQLRESASSRNWSAVRPYVHYNNVPQQQHQQRNFFAQPQQQHHQQQQQQQQQNFNNYQQPQPQNRFNNFNNGGNRY